MRKILVVAVDGVEYTFLRDHHELKGFRQREFGFHSVPHLSTQVLFPCFIAGADPHDLLNYGSQYVNRLWRRFTGRYFFRPRTIFDTIKPSLAVEVPGYTPGKIMSNRTTLDIDKYGQRMMEKLVHQEFYDTLRTLMDTHDEDSYRFIMAHFGILDLYQHWAALFGEEAIHAAYCEVDDALRLLQSIYEDWLIFVVSDHGLIDGIHQPYGFWSTSEKLGLKELWYPDLTWTDFRQIFEFLSVDGFMVTIPPLEDDWKLSQTLQILNKVRNRRLHLIHARSLEFKVLRHILDDCGLPYEIVDTPRRFTGMYLHTKRWYDGSNYMAYQILGREMNPLAHWTWRDIQLYAIKHDIPYPIPDSYKEETIEQLSQGMVS